MRRAWVLVAVLVLGAWTCAPVDDGGADMSMTTTGFATLAAGEPWRYVGDTDQPAFDGDWANALTGFPKMAFRLRGTDDVDLIGTVEPGSLTSGNVFTLPEGYRPTAANTPVNISVVNAGVTSPRVLVIQDTGEVLIGGVGETTASGDVYFINGTFPLTVPDVAP